MRFFLSLFAGFLSLSIVGDRWNRLVRFLSLLGVAISGFWSPSNLSWLVIAEAAFADGAKPEIPIAEGAAARDEGELFRAASAGAEGERPLGAASWEGKTLVAFGDGEPEFFCSRFCGKPGDFFDGTVLLR
jgi:hypothetical protein